MTPFGPELGAYSATQKDKKTGKPQFVPGEEWRCTTKENKLYFFLLKWPGEKFTIAGLKGQAAKAYLLADSARQPLALAQDGARLTVTLPAAAPDPLASVLCMELAP
jgi:hypothetical protein